MKKLLLTTLFILSILLLPVWAGAATYNWYFSDDAAGNAAGNDTTGDGSIGTPWKTLAKAQTQIDAVNSDDIVNLYFDRGDTWSMNTGATVKTLVFGLLIGSDDPVVNINAYGTGDKPCFDGLVADFSTASVHNTTTGPLKWSAIFQIEKNGCSVQNIELTRVYGKGIVIKGVSIGAPSLLISNVDANNIGADAFVADLDTGCQNAIVEYCNVHTGQELWRYYLRDGWGAGINLTGASGLSDNNIVRYNLVYDIYGEGINNPNSLTEYNVVGDTASIGINIAPHSYNSYEATIRYNLVTMSDWSTSVYDNMHGGGSSPVGIRIFDEPSGGGGGDNSGADFNIYGNVVINRGIGIKIQNTVGESSFGLVKVYNNTIIDSHTGNFYTTTPDLFDAVYIYNNASILYDQVSSYHAAGTVDAGWTIDNNAFWTTGGSPTVDAAWRTNYVTTDPKLPGEPSVDWDGQSGATYFSDIDFDTHLYPPSDSGLVDTGKALGAGFATSFLTIGTDFGDLPTTVTFELAVKPQGEGWDIGTSEYVPVGDPPPAPGGDWGRKCELVIQNSQVPGNVPNFPVLITAATLPAEMIDTDDAGYAAGQAQADGGDLRFYTDSAGTNRLACEIVDFTHHATTPTAEIWVLVPTAYGAVDTSIWVYYNATGKAQPAEDAAYGSEAVWDNYQSAWHFEEADAGNNTVYYDETSNDNDGTLIDADDDSTRGTGQIGASIDFNGDADYINAGAGASLEMGLSDWSMSTWFKGAAGTNALMEKGVASSVEGYNFWYYGTDDDLRSYLIEDSLTNIYGESNNTLGADDSAFHHVAVTHDRDDNATFYLDGSAVGTFDISAFSAEDITNSGRALFIGRHVATYSVTSIDETRIYKGLLSANWLAAEFNNQSAPNTFIVEGSPGDVTTTDTTRATITAVGRWIEATKTCDTTTAITYDAAGDVIPLCLVCDEALSIEVPGIESSPTLTLLPGPLTASEGTAVYAGYDNSGATTVIKANYTVRAGERSTDLNIKAVTSFSIGLGTTKAITTITKANPGVVTTAAAHGLITGNYAYFNQMGEMTEIEDNCYEITYIDATSFSIIDTSGFVAAEADGGSEECFKVDSYMVDPYDNMLDVDLTAAGLDLGVVTIAVPYSSTAPLEFDATNSMAAWIATGDSPIPDDFFKATVANSIGTVDLSAYDGTSGHQITIDGGGFADDGVQTWGDYYTVKRMIK